MSVTTDDPQLMAAVQKEVEEMELESKLKTQKKGQSEVTIHLALIKVTYFYGY